MMPSELQFTCPACRDRFDTPLVNGVGEFQCFGCKSHFRIVVSSDAEPGDFEKREVSWQDGNYAITEWESVPQEVKLTFKLTRLKDASEYFSRPAAP